MSTPEDLPELGNTESDRDTLLAEMSNLGNEEAEALEPNDAADLSKEEPTAAETEEAETPEEATEEATEEAEEPEPDLALEKMQQAEKRSKERMSAHMEEQRAALAKEQQDWSDRMAEADRILADREAASRRTFDPEGKSSAELMAEARRIHALAKAAGPDAKPQDKAAAERLSRDRTIEDRLAAAEKRAADIEALYKSDKEEAANKIQAEKFTNELVAGITDDTPLVKRLLEGKGKAKARDRILNIAAYLHSQSGENPDPIDVFKIYEEAERAELEERGIDPDAVLSATPKNKTPEATEKKSATLGNDLGISTPPRSEPLTEQEERDDLLKGMAGL